MAVTMNIGGVLVSLPFELPTRKRLIEQQAQAWQEMRSAPPEQRADAIKRVKAAGKELRDFDRTHHITG